MKGRILWLDNLKGFLILIVILGHTILFTDGTWDSNIVSRFIISFWMYLFMFTSGFASYKSELNFSIIKRRFYQLIIPFVAWSLVLSVFNDEYSFEDMVLYPGQSVWFLFVLFWIITINFFVCKLSSILEISDVIPNVIVTILLLLIAKIVKDPTVFDIAKISQYYASYIIGWYVRKNWPLIKSYLGWGFFSICMVIWGGMAFFNKGDYVPFGLPRVLHMGYNILCGIISFGFFVPLFANLFDREHHFLGKLGGGTLGLYTIHIAVYTVLFHFYHSLVFADLGTFKYVLYVIALFLGVFIVSLLIYKVLELNKITALILLGKHK